MVPKQTGWHHTHVEGTADCGGAMPGRARLKYIPASVEAGVGHDMLGGSIHKNMREL